MNNAVKNLGVIAGRLPSDYIAGYNSPLPYYIVNESGNWSDFEPPAENQNSNQMDSMACVSFSLTHIIETQIKFYTGKTVDLSERFLAKVSNTTLQGNYLSVVADALKKYGVCSQEDWPVPPNFTWDEFYAPIPQEILDKAKRFWDNWEFGGYEFLTALQAPDYLKQAPLQIVITQEYPHHAVELVNQGTYFDSYAPYNKQVGTVHDYFKFLIKPKKNMLFETIQVEGSPEVYLVRDGKKTHVYNIGAFNIVTDGSSVRKVTQEELDAIPDSGLELASLVKE